ncbi:collagen binding domain-containing protein [Clostridium tetani]|uniref:collagen binding domain-containing protein n=1 Tax=Clostridium tetani TaxID=1513 RepID=UPI00100BE5AC|nr:collagen binding domain-containing protein [Clostridium tetani]RXM58936.1 hypothetical protein DP133_01905 [Clostridium tetani]
MKTFDKIIKGRKNIIIILTFLFQILLCSKTVLAANVDVIDNVKITNENGVVQGGYRPGDRIRIDVDWSIKSETKAGDTFSLKIPKELRGFNGTIQLKDKEGRNFGTGVGKGDVITFTFSDIVEKLENISGFFYIQSEIKYIERQGEIEVPLVFEVNGKAIKNSIIVDTGSTNSGGSPSKIAEMFQKWGRINENDDNIIDWVLRVNYKGEQLYNITITDMISKGHEFVDGSLELYKGYTNHRTGNIDNQTKVPLKYPVNFSSSPSGFKLKLYNESETYTLYYQTKIVDKSIFDFRNKATLEAYNKKPIIKEIMVKDFSSGGGASGDLKKYKGKLKLIKQDKTTGELLEGAVFELINDENKVVTTLTTNRKGEAITNEVLGGIYTLKEIKAPEGYRIYEGEQEIIIKSQGKVVEVKVENRKSKTSSGSGSRNPDPEKPETKDPPIDKGDELPPQELDVIKDKLKDKLVDKDKKPSVKVNEVEKKDSSVNILLGKKEVKPKKSVDVLPKTGENGPIFNYVLGLLLIVGGLYLRKR